MPIRLQGPLGPQRRLRPAAGCAVCIDGFNSTARCEITNGGPAGAFEMSRVSVFRTDATIAATGGMHGRFNSGAPRGWTCRGSSGASRFEMAVVNAAVVLAVSPAYAIGAGHVGRVSVVFHTLESVVAQRLRAFSGDGGTVAEIGAPGTAVLGYTGPAGSDDFEIGNENPTATRPMTWGAVLACAGSDTLAWSTAQMQAILDNIRANCGRITTAVPSETFRFNAPDCFPPASWVGASGGTASVQGSDTSLIVRERFKPIFM